MKETRETTYSGGGGDTQRKKRPRHALSRVL